MLGTNYAPEDDPLASLALKDRGNISVYARHRDYHDLIKGRLKQLGSWLAALAPSAELKVFVDTAPVMEKPLAQSAGLGWQGKHTNLVSREARLLAVSRRALHRSRDRARRGGAGPLRLLPRLPRCLPDKGFSAALSARCAALHLLSHHRAQGPYPGASARSDRQPHLWLRRLPRRLPVEQIRAGLARSQIAGARRSRRAAPRGSARARRCGLSRAFFRQPGEAHRQRALCPQSARSPPAIPAICRCCRLSRRGWTIPRRSVRAMAVWALWRLAPARAAALAARHRADEADADVLAEWRRVEAPVEVRQ